MLSTLARPFQRADTSAAVSWDARYFLNVAAPLGLGLLAPPILFPFLSQPIKSSANLTVFSPASLPLPESQDPYQVPFSTLESVLHVMFSVFSLFLCFFLFLTMGGRRFVACHY